MQPMRGMGGVSLGNPAPPAAPSVRSAEREISPFGVPDLDPRDFGAFSKLGTRTFNAGRQQLAGGALVSLIQHPAILSFERLYRRLPEEGMFDASVAPNNPFTFELGAFRVPTQFTLLIFDIRPDVYRFSGLDPGDYVPVETRRFSSVMGFSLNVDQRLPGNVEFQLDPAPIQVTNEAFTPLSQPTNATFNLAKSNTFANASGTALGTLPQRPTRFGALNVPFTLIAKSNQTVQARAVVFKPIPSPIAFIEFDIAGVLIPSQWTDSVLDIISPPTTFGETKR
jgi:hypothetical protein